MLLGIELDTVSQELRIDPTRLAEIIDPPGPLNIIVLNANYSCPYWQA